MKAFITAIFCLVAYAASSQFELLDSGTSNGLRDVHFINRDTGLVIGANGTILRTEDAGEHWEIIDIGVTHLLQHIEFTNDSVGYITGHNGVLMKTVNGGSNWSSVAPEGQTGDFFNLSFTSPDTGYVTYENGILYTTTNGGSSWTPINVPLSVFGPIYFHTAARGIVTGYKSNGDKSILSTEDTYITWEPFDTAMNQYYLNVDFPTADTGFICTTGGSGTDGLIFRSTDGGQSWQFVYRKIATGGLFSIQFPSALVGYAAGGWWPDACLLRTIDGGNTWTSYEFENSFTACYFIDENNGFVVGGGGTIYRVSFETVDNNEVNFDSDFEVTPNPVVDEIVIHDFDQQYSPLIAKVYDLTGRIVLTKELIDSKRLDVRNLPVGSYLLQLKTNHATYSKQIIKF
jgi:photosystem II stability/assembly factor-like uncharacterized protein